MHNLRQFYHQNKNKVRGFIAAIAFIFIIIQFFNKMLKGNINSEIDENILNNISTNTNTNSNNQEKDTYIKSEQSVVTGENINTTILNTSVSLIEKFISSCNDGNIEEAYNLLSEDCKNLNYKDMQTFKKLYYDKVFSKNSKKVATIENWTNDTYRVSITNDALSTGKVSDSKIQDYITIVREGEKLKLNINSFIYVEEINLKRTTNNLTFNVLEKNVYMDYEEYIIQIENKTNNNIILDTQTNPKSIYLQDINNIKYYAYNNEIISTLLKINKGYSTQLSLKFERKYSSFDQKINSIIFSDVVLDTNDSINKKIININI